MDPISALGFTCNVLDLIQLAIKTGAIMKQIYESPEGLRKKHESLLKQSKTLKTVVDGLEDIQSQMSQIQSTLNTRMQEVAVDCASVSAAIKKVLDKCKPKEKSLVSAAKSTFQLFLHRSDIEDLQAELDKHFKILTSLTATKTLVRIGKLKTQLHHASQRLETKLQDSKGQQSLVLEKLDALDDSLTGVAKSEPLLEQLKEILDAITVASDTLKFARILENLRFPSMDDRFQTVRDSAPDTFNWIFDEPDMLLRKQPGLAISFPEWLRTGSGIFHIQGKPGSGKSTLMKFICEHKSRDQLLGEWASRRALICSQFFFWSIGSTEEKSFGGLIRGLLSGVIQHDLSLAKILFPNSWGSDYSRPNLPLVRPLKLTDKEVSAAFDAVIHDQSIVDKYRICFFIDGLDEFDENLGFTYHSLTQKLRQWSHNSTGRVKFCVSSRELPVFVKAFDEKQRITIQIFTERDINSLVKQKLDNNEMFQKLQETKPGECIGLKQQILSNADGVFLWVIILLNQLEDALINEDSVTKLQESVRSAPIELDAFFQHILDTIPRRYRQKAYTLLAMAMRMTGMLLSEESRESIYVSYDHFVSKNQEFITAISCYSLLEALDHASPREITSNTPPSIKLDDDTYNARISLTKTQVAAHCRGLLEHRELVGRGDLGPIFRFTHRSIPEFLQRTLSGNRETYGLDDQLVGELLTWILIVNLKFQLLLPIDDSRWQDEFSEADSSEGDLISSDQESSGNNETDEEKKNRKISEPKEKESNKLGQSKKLTVRPSHKPDSVIGDKLREESNEKMVWDNPLLRSDRLVDILLLNICCLRQIRLQNADTTCRLLHLIDAEILQYQFQAAALDELPDKARETFGRLINDSNNTEVENASCLSIATLAGFNEYWAWYLEKSVTPLCDRLWYLLNIIMTIINAGPDDDEDEDWNRNSFYSTIFESFFRAGISVDTIVPFGTNQKSIIWHNFLLSLFIKSFTSTLSLKEKELTQAGWEQIEIWLKYGADPRLTFSTTYQVDSTYMSISVLTHNGTNILRVPVYLDKKGGLKKGIAGSFQKIFSSSGGVFTFYDLVQFLNPPNVEELLRLINFNKREREAKNNESIIGLSLSRGQLHEDRNLAPERQTEADYNPEPSSEIDLKQVAEIPINPLIPTNTLPRSVTFPSSLRIWILFNICFITGLAYILIYFWPKSVPI